MIYRVREDQGISSYFTGFEYLVKEIKSYIEVVFVGSNRYILLKQFQCMIDIPFYWVDVFTSEPFKGNPAAVCIINTEYDDSLYQKIAKEIGLVETAFTDKIDKNTYNLRWFTPRFEVQLCGHATIATAHVLSKEHHVKTPIYFQTLSGKLKVDIKENKVTLNYPTFTYEKLMDERILEPLGIEDYVEIRFWRESPVPSFFIVLRNEDQVKEIKPDYPRLIEVSEEFGIVGIIVTAPGKTPYDYVFRQFAPRAGINEEQGTGVVHCVAAPYWAEELGKNKMRAYQFSERGSEMEIELKDKIVKITGSAVQLIKGKMSISLPVE